MTPEWIKDALAAAGMATPFQSAAPAAPEVALNATPADPGTPLYVRPAWLDQAALGAHPDERGATLFGPAGTGKTTAIHRLATELGAKLITFQAADGCGIEDLIGFRELVDGEKGPKTAFTPGPLPEALEADCWLLIEEANAMRPGVFSKLNTLLDGSGDTLRLPDGRRLAAGPGFRLWLAYNPGYAGMREVNQALVDRLCPVYTSYLPAPSEAHMLAARSGCDLDTALRVALLAEKIRAARFRFDLSPRALFRMLRIVRAGRSWSDAFAWAILDRIGDPVSRAADRDACKQIADLDDLATWPTPDFKVAFNATDADDAGEGDGE